MKRAPASASATKLEPERPAPGAAKRGTTAEGEETAAAKVVSIDAFRKK